MIFFRKFLVVLTVSLRGMSGIFGSASNISFVENALVIRISPSTQLAIGPAVEFTVKGYELNTIKMTTGMKCG